MDVDLDLEEWEMFRNETSAHFLHDLVGSDPKEGKGGKKEAVKGSKVWLERVDSSMAAGVTCFMKTETNGVHCKKRYLNSYGKILQLSAVYKTYY